MSFPVEEISHLLDGADAQLDAGIITLHLEHLALLVRLLPGGLVRLLVEVRIAMEPELGEIKI